MKTGLLTLLGIMFLTAGSFAQNGSFSGTVSDGRTGVPLSGATVTLVGTNLGAITDSLGSYTIANIPPKSYNVSASSIGYEVQTMYDVVVRSEGNIDVNFQLTEAAKQLEDVVVVANPF